MPGVEIGFIGFRKILLTLDYAHFHREMMTDPFGTSWQSCALSGANVDRNRTGRILTGMRRRCENPRPALPSLASSFNAERETLGSLFVISDSGEDGPRFKGWTPAIQR